MIKKKKCWKRRGKEFNRKSHAWHNIIGWSCTIADPRIPGTLLPPNSRKVKKKLIKNLKSPLKLQKNPSQFPALFSFFYFSLYSARLSLSTLWSLKWRRNPKNVRTMNWFLLWYRLSGEKMQTATQQIPTFVSSENPFPTPKPVTDGPTATNQRWLLPFPFHYYLIGFKIFVFVFLNVLFFYFWFRVRWRERR